MITTTRTRLLQAARRRIARYGYAETSVEQIAAAAGLTKGAYYSQFGSKLDIMVELILAWSRETVSRIERSRRPADALAALLRGARGGAAWEPVLVDSWRLALEEPRIREALAAEHRRIERALAARLEADPANARDSARRAVNLHVGLTATRALGAAPAPSLGEVAALLDDITDASRRRRRSA